MSRPSLMALRHKERQRFTVALSVNELLHAVLMKLPTLNPHNDKTLLAFKDAQIKHWWPLCSSALSVGLQGHMSACLTGKDIWSLSTWKKIWAFTYLNVGVQVRFCF